MGEGVVREVGRWYGGGMAVVVVVVVVVEDEEEKPGRFVTC
jgi:hypothetical protein